MNTISSSRVVPRTRLAMILLACTLLTISPLGVMAQDIGWSPQTMTFPSTVIGTTATQTLSLTNNDGALPLDVNSIEWTYNEPGEVTFTPSYTFTGDRPVPATLLPGESMTVDISFSPEGLSFKAANLLVTNTSGNQPSLNYFITGEGVYGDGCAPLDNCYGTCTDLSNDLNNCGSCDNVCDEPVNGTALCETGICTFVCDEGYEPVGDGCQSIVSQTPVEMLQALIAFVDGSVADGTLLGLGPKGSVGYQTAEYRLELFGRMLDDALYKLTHESNVNATCAMLNTAQLRSDGGYPFVLPIDFVAGEATAEVYQRIIEVITALDCEIREAPTRPVK